MPFNFSEDTVKAITLAFNNVREFIIKPEAGWTITVALALFLYINGNDKYDRGVLDGRNSSKEERLSLMQNAQNNREEIKSLNNTVNYYKLKLDTCTKNSNEDLSNRLDNMYKEQDRIDRIIDNRLSKSEQLNLKLKNLPR